MNLTLILFKRNLWSGYKYINSKTTNHYYDHFATKHTNLSLGLMYTIENLYHV